MQIKFIFFLLVIIMSNFFGCNMETPQYHPSQIIETSHAIVYLPSKWNPKKETPIVFSFSPSGDANTMLGLWQPLAEKHQWIFYASKDYKNTVNSLEGQINGFVIINDMKKSLKLFHADKSRVILTGLSGGTSFSHLVNIENPNFASALILNTGKCWYFDRITTEEVEKISRSYTTSRRLAIFLASPTDFRYQEMRRDKEVYDEIGWKTQWIEFPGGHDYAPTASYEQALHWLEEQPAWTKK